ATMVSVGSDYAGCIKQATGDEIRKDSTLLSMLRRPGITARVLSGPLGLDAPIELLQQVEIEAKYDGYIRRQDESIERAKKQEQLALPNTFDYGVVEGLSNELKQKLSHAKPTNLANASRIPGMTPAAISLLAVHAKRGQRTNAR
ncbi:MAG TPA: tRNA uridine-5-carboxymethylaminomethyl(34) synthesis enzyme MnmG, partial [Gammaproteobacteria bacterium]|nr:tRNA uridine-5-carboxymethylaminomethyl(34) synthesis enzyme MnmG [Gammaproteobacteria bacterium]